MLKRKEKIVLAGGGGHAKVIIDALRSSGEFEIDGITDSNLLRGTAVLGVKVIGTDDALSEAFAAGVKKAFIAVGSIGDYEPRKKIYALLKKIGFALPVIVHPKAVVAGDVLFGEGAFVAAGAVINPGTKIGKNAIINTRSSVDHDCVIGDFVHVAPGATLSGGVSVGEGTHIGTGASVTQYIRIGKRCMVGAGTTLRHDMETGSINYGDRISAGKNEEK